MQKRVGRWGVVSLLCAGLMACVPGEGNPDGGAGQRCGSRGLGQCDEGEFCSFAPAAQCGEFDAPGICTPTPDICTKEYRPVCGCDRVTYGNPCMAAAASVSVRADGECPQPGAFCGGIAGIQCPADQFCSFPPSAQCGAGDQGGTCARRPEACIALYDPVCGCDGQTYGSACNAASAGVSVASDGECPNTP